MNESVPASRRPSDPGLTTPMALVTPAELHEMNPSGPLTKFAFDENILR